MPSFTITKHGKTYEFSIPEPEYEVPERVMELVSEGELRVEYNPLIVWSVLDSGDAQVAYLRYVITKLWSKDECGIVEAFVEDYDTCQGELPAFLEDFVDWGDVWERGVMSEIPETNDIKEDECLLALLKIRKDIEKEEKRVRKEEQRRENKATLERKIAEKEELLAKLMREKEEMEALKKQYD